jgi:hypothetical protein
MDQDTRDRIAKIHQEESVEQKEENNGTQALS